MSSLRTYITTAAVTVLALSPAAAMAAGTHATPKLGGNPQMRLVDSHHATLKFASDRLGKTADGKLDAKITFADGSRVSGLKATGTHAGDIVYSARVTSSKPLQLHSKVRVTFRLGDSKPVQRFVKLFAPGEHG
jgi:hypothetical protein